VLVQAILSAAIHLSVRSCLDELSAVGQVVAAVVFELVGAQSGVVCATGELAARWLVYLGDQGLLLDGGIRGSIESFLHVCHDVGRIFRVDPVMRRLCS
jgi:hypothetical protein